MYIVTATNDGQEVPMGAFEANNDVEAMMILQDRRASIIDKATNYFFGSAPEDLTLWNTYGEPACVQRTYPKYLP